MSTPRVLDPCCGSRMMWFNRQHPDAIYGDKRAESHVLCDGRQLHIEPDTVMDFRALPFGDGSFHLVVFDPPHLKHAGAKYGVLEENWREDLRQGFSECFAVLLSCTEEQAEELTRKGEIPGTKFGKSWIYVRSDLLAYVAERARQEAQERRASKQG